MAQTSKWITYRAKTSIHTTLIWLITFGQVWLTLGQVWVTIGQVWLTFFWVLGDTHVFFKLRKSMPRKTLQTKKQPSAISGPRAQSLEKTWRAKHFQNHVIW